MEGLGLLRLLIESTGIPQEAMERELSWLLIRHGLSPETMTLEDVREVLASYLQDVLLEAKRSVG